MEAEKKNENMEAEKKAENMKTDKKKTGIGDIVNSIIALISSQIVLGGLMAFLGLRVALSPDSAPKKIAWGLGLAILIATVGLLIGFISTKTFNRSNLLPIVETFIFMILGACMIIFAKKFGVMLEETVCFAIIISSVINLLCLKNLNDIQSKIDARMEAQRARRSENAVLQEVGDAVRADFDKYNGEFVNAANHVKGKFGKTTTGQIILNVMLIIIAIVMLVTRFSDAGSIYLISGIIMVLSGLNEIVLGIRSIREKKRADKLEAE